MVRKNIRSLFYILLCGYLFIIVQLTYLQIFRSNELLAHPKNTRLSSWEQNIIRGGIYDRNGEPLARTVAVEGKMHREYPLGAAAGAITGYNSFTRGKASLEAEYNDVLLGFNPDMKLIRLLRRFGGGAVRGNDIYLTIDMHLQRSAYELLRGMRGAAVIMEADSGRILVLSSSPGFDPNNIENKWKQLNQIPGSPFLNRAIQGLYPPGSSLKIMNGALALSEGEILYGRQYFCPGYLEIKGRILKCPYPHREVDIITALARSCNVSFARWVIEMGPEAFYQGALRFGFNRDWDFDLPVKASNVPPPNRLTPNSLAECAIGQGEVLVTPLHMAVITSVIANGGTLYRPYLVRSIKDPSGSLVKQFEPRKMGAVINPWAAALVKRGMVEAVQEGTAQAAGIPGVEVAGKTGTAENPGGKPHAWFVAFARGKDANIAVAVVVENGGRGGQVAAPIARKLLAKALEF